MIINRWRLQSIVRCYWQSIVMNVGESVALLFLIACSHPLPPHIPSHLHRHPGAHKQQ